MDEQEIERIFRKHYKYIRTKNECKLETLAKALNISASYLSQWENNKRNLSEDIVSDMFEYFKIDGKNVCLKFVENLKCLYLCYLDVLYIKGRDRFEEFEHNLPSDFAESMEFPYYLVIYYLYNCGKPNLELQTKIENVFPFLSDEFIGIYYLAVGCAHTNSKDYNNAIKYYQKGFSATTNPNVTSMLHFNCGNTYLRCSTISDTLNEITIAKREFEECLAIKRSIAIMNSLGIIEMNNFKYEKSIEILLKTVDLCDYLRIYEFYDVLINNLAFVYLLKKDYKLSLYYANKLLADQKRVTSCTYFYIMYDLFQLHKYSESLICLEEYKKMISANTVKFDCHHALIELMDSIWVEQNTKTEINLKIKEVYTIINKESGVALRLFTLDFIISYYKQNKNYKKCNEFLTYKNELMAITR